jgi:hypothetical protein
MIQPKRPRGRPPAPERPKPVSWRPDTAEQRAKWIRIGGARWLKRVLNEAKEDQPKGVKDDDN